MRTHRPVCRDVEQAHGLPSRTSTDESRRSHGNRKLRSSARRSDLALPFVAQALRQGLHRSPGALGVEMADETMLTRRNFVRLAGASTLSLFFTDRLGVTRQLFAQIPDTLDPATVAKFATPMLIPAVMPRAGRITLAGGKNADYYEISMKQFTQQILPEGLPRTTVWGYGAVASESQRGLLVHNAPSLTIEAKWNRPVRVKWINDLRDPGGDFLPHLLPVDPTLHWANPPGGVSGRDSRPRFETTPGPYTGPVPIVTHVHGAVGVADDSDGYTEAWYLPAAGNIPADYATVGTWFDFFAAKAGNSYGVTWEPGSAIFQYPNKNRASTIWYHDHTLGMTRLNVYAGPAGFYLIRGGPAGDDEVLDSGTGARAVLPGPAPRENDKFPPNKTYYEIPIAIQDRSFNTDGSLFYNGGRTRWACSGSPAKTSRQLSSPKSSRMRARRARHSYTPWRLSPCRFSGVIRVKDRKRLH
jgi:spore coat protein A